MSNYQGEKKRICNAIIKSILMHDAETWKLTQADKKKITAVEMNELRRLCRMPRRNQIRNVRIREMMGTEQTVIEDIQKRNN